MAIALTKNKIDRSKTAVFQLVTGAVMISFSGVWVKIAHVTPVVSAFYRVFFGGFFLLAILLYRKEKFWHGWQFAVPATLCALFFALDLYVWHKSIVYIGPGLATILSNFQVFPLTLAGLLFFHEKLSKRFALSVPLAIAGLFMIVGIDWSRFEPAYRTGIYLGLATAFFYAVFLLMLKKLQSRGSGPSAVYNLTIVSFVSAIFLALNIAGTGGAFAIPDTQSGLSLAALGLFSQTVGWILITRSLPHVGAGFAGLILLLQPSLSFIWDVLFFNRETSMTSWYGVALTLAAIYMGSTGKKPAAS